MNKQILGKIFMLLLPAAMLILIVGLALRVTNNSSQTTTPLPTPNPTPITTTTQSRWSNDPTVLEIKANIKNLSDQVGKVDLKESGLQPPILDMNIKF